MTANPDLVNGMDPARDKWAEYQARKRLAAVPEPEPDIEAELREVDRRWAEREHRRPGPIASSAGGGQIQSAAMYGYLFHPKAAKPYSASARLLVMHLASTKGGQWSVNGPRSLPLAVLARRLDIPLRTIERCLVELQDEDGPHGGPVIEVWTEDVGKRVPKVTYALTKEFRQGAVAYAKSVVGPTSKGSGPIYRKHPEARLSEIAEIKARDSAKHRLSP